MKTGRHPFSLLLTLVFAVLLPSVACARENAARIPVCGAPPVLDGAFGEGEWDGAAALSWYCGMAEKLSDRRVETYAMYDEKNLYIAAKVRDNKHYQIIRGGGLWAGDCIQFSVVDGGPLSPLRSQDASALNEFAISADNKGPFLFSWCSREAGVQENAQIAVTGGDGEIIYEVALPWESINVTRPASRKKLGVSFVVADNDGDNLRGWLEWTPGVFGYEDASEYGCLTLE